MGAFQCPQCLALYSTLDLLVSHMERDDNISAEWITQWVSIFANRRPQPEPPSHSPFNSSTDTDTDTTEIDLAVARFRVWFVLDGVTIHRREIPGNETFEGFCSQMESLFYKPKSKFAVNQFEYVLIAKKQDGRMNAEPFTGSSSYRLMKNELLENKSPWRHATVQRIVTVSDLLLCHHHEPDMFFKGSFGSGVVRENASDGRFIPATSSQFDVGSTTLIFPLDITRSARVFVSDPNYNNAATTTYTWGIPLSECGRSAITNIASDPDPYPSANGSIRPPSTNGAPTTSAFAVQAVPFQIIISKMDPTKRASQRSIPKPHGLEDTQLWSKYPQSKRRWSGPTITYHRPNTPVTLFAAG